MGTSGCEAKKAAHQCAVAFWIVPTSTRRWAVRRTPLDISSSSSERRSSLRTGGKSLDHFGRLNDRAVPVNRNQQMICNWKGQRDQLPALPTITIAFWNGSPCGRITQPACQRRIGRWFGWSTGVMHEKDFKKHLLAEVILRGRGRARQNAT